MFDDIEQKNLVELRDIDRELFPIQVPADELWPRWHEWCGRRVTVHSRDAAALLDQFGRNQSLAAADIEHVPARTCRGERRRVRGFVAELQIVRFLRRMHIELAIETHAELVQP